MGILSFSRSLVAGSNENVNDVQTMLNEAKDSVNNIVTGQVTDGTLTAVDLSATTNSYLGLTDGSSTRRGASVIATEQSVTSTSYTTLGTADTVSSLVVPTNGLLFVVVQALWKSSVAGAGRAALFVGANQIKVPDQYDGSSYDADGDPDVQEARTTDTKYEALLSHTEGFAAATKTPSLYSFPGYTGAAFIDATDVTTGTFAVPLVVAGLAAGTYDVSLKFKSASGSVTAKNRKLWTWVTGF